jgi:superfamily II DNA or RNA helicase
MESQVKVEAEEPGSADVAAFLDSLPACCDVLRPYQRDQLAGLCAALHAGHRRVVMQAPTGSGKTHLIASLCAAALAGGLPAIVLATRTRLVRQIHDRLTEFRVPHGVVSAPLPALRHHACPVQVASVDTLYRRALVDRRMPLPSATVVIFDEAHLAGADSRLVILDSYPSALRVGLTATPARKSGRGLGAVFDLIIAGPSTLDLIAAGALVRPRVFNVPVVSEAELAAVPRDMDSDYQPRALGQLLSRPPLLGDVVQNWLRIAAGKRTFCFAVNKPHGAELVQEFTRAGVAAELITDRDAEEAREQAIARLESGKTQVLVNCFLLSYGVDLPSVECIVLARPTRSLVMYLQMVGRGMRSAPRKDSFLLIDHGRVVESLGLPHVPREWTLDVGRNVNNEAREYTRKRTEEKPRTCPECQHMWLVSQEGEACRECGWKPGPKPKAVLVEAAELAELMESEALTAALDSPEVRQFFREVVHWYSLRWPARWAERPGRGRWFAWCKTRERFHFPETTPIPRSFWTLSPISPTAAVNGWLKSQQIRYARRRRA